MYLSFYVLVIVFQNVTLFSDIFPYKFAILI